MKKVIFLVLIIALIGGGVAIYFYQKKNETSITNSFKIMELEPVVINLADGHYIRIAIA